MTSEKHTIKSGIDKRGFGLHQFFKEEYAQISEKMGIVDYEAKSPSQWKTEFLNAIGVEPHVRPSMTPQEKQAKLITKIARETGVSNEKLKQAMELLKL